jgi:AbiV family abortive infection protein
MARATRTSVSSAYLTTGAVYALEQCGFLLQDAVGLYRSGSYGSAVALASFAREELGRCNILLDLRTRLLAGETVSVQEIADSCEDHVEKQKRGALSTMQSGHKESGLGRLLESRRRADPQSEEWKIADDELGKIDEKQRKRAPLERHAKRLRGIYVDPDDSGVRWNRPREFSNQEAYAFLTAAANDYAIQQQKFEPELGSDAQLLKQIAEWADCPKFPLVEHPNWPELSPK